MLLQLRSGAACFLAVLAISLQIFLPGAVSVAQANGVDTGRFLCTTPGFEPSAEAVETARRLAALLGDEAPEEAPVADDCPLCLLGQAVPLPGPVLIVAPAVFPAAVHTPQYDPGFAHPPRGPPLGPRAPPALI